MNAVAFGCQLVGILWLLIFVLQDDLFTEFENIPQQPASGSVKQFAPWIYLLLTPFYVSFMLVVHVVMNYVAYGHYPLGKMLLWKYLIHLISELFVVDESCLWKVTLVYLDKLFSWSILFLFSFFAVGKSFIKFRKLFILFVYDVFWVLACR